MLKFFKPKPDNKANAAAASSSQEKSPSPPTAGNGVVLHSAASSVSRMSRIGDMTPPGIAYDDEFRYRTVSLFLLPFAFADLPPHLRHAQKKNLFSRLTLPTQMINYLYRKAVASGWISPKASSEDQLGVLLRRARGHYVTAPEPVHHDLLGAVIRLNAIVSLTMQPDMLEGILNSLAPGQTELHFKDGSQLQIIDSLSIAHPTSVKKFQYACICRQEKLVLVWQDDLQKIIPQATSIEEKLFSLVRFLLQVLETRASCI
jgi:hypothetical protein